jgi:hypothetical protein
MGPFACGKLDSHQEIHDLFARSFGFSWVPDISLPQVHVLPPQLVPHSILLTSPYIAPLRLCSLAIINSMTLTNPPTYFHLKSKHPCHVFIIKDLILCRINCWWNVVQCVHDSNFFIFGDIPKEWFFRPFFLQWNLFMMLVYIVTLHKPISIIALHLFIK